MCRAIKSICQPNSVVLVIRFYYRSVVEPHGCDDAAVIALSVQ